MKIINLITDEEITTDTFSNNDYLNPQFEIRDLKEKDLELLSRKFNIDLLDLEDVYDQEERPRVDFDVKNQYLELVLRYPLDFNSENKSTPIICFLKPKCYCIILHRLEDFISLSTKSMKRLRHEIIANVEYLPVLSLMKYLIGLASQTEKTIKQLQTIKDDLENQIFKSRETEGLKDMFHLSKSVVVFENNMKGNLIQLRKIMNHETLKIKDNSEIGSRFDDLETDFEQYYDQIRIMREIINSSLDAYGSVIANNLNEVMKTLTVFTILLTSPILIASIYGMNVPLPFSGHPYTIYFILILSVFLSVIMIFYMKQRNML